MKVDMKEMYKFAKSQFEHAVVIGSNECAYLKGVMDAYYMACINCIDNEDVGYHYGLIKRYKGKKSAEYHKGFYEAGVFILDNM